MHWLLSSLARDSEVSQTRWGTLRHASKFTGPQTLKVRWVPSFSFCFSWNNKESKSASLLELNDHSRSIGQRVFLWLHLLSLCWDSDLGTAVLLPRAVRGDTAEHNLRITGVLGYRDGTSSKNAWTQQQLQQLRFPFQQGIGAHAQ